MPKTKAAFPQISGKAVKSHNRLVILRYGALNRHPLVILSDFA